MSFWITIAPFIVALCFLLMVALMIWQLLREEEDPRPLLDLYEQADFDADVPEGMPRYRRAA